MAGNGSLLSSGSGKSCPKRVASQRDKPVIASRMTSYENRSVRRSKRPHRPPRQCQGRQSCRLSSQEECLQGRRSSEEGAEPRSPLRPRRHAAAEKMPRGCLGSFYGIRVGHPLRPTSMLGYADQCGASVTVRCFATSLNTFPKAGTLWRNLSKSIFGMIKTSIAVHARIVALRVLLDSNAISPEIRAAI